MAILSCSGIHLSFGARVVLEDVSFSLEPGDRVGLIGSNGRGKTTLLRILAGQQKPDSGEVVLAAGARMGYLPQEIRVESDHTLLDFVHHAAGDRRAIENQLIALEKVLANTLDETLKHETAVRIAELHERLFTFDESYSLHEAQRILVGLGFRSEDWGRPLAQFSGGWKMRALLASLLFLQPDVLLLDEPTNHLDLPSLAWLDAWISSYRGAFIIISHDRDFLDRHVRRVLALEPEGFRQYRGNFTDARRLREEEEAILENRKKNLERERREAERFIERFKAQANKARQAKSKAKMLKKMEVIDVPLEEERIRFRFPPVERSGDRVLQVTDLAKSFGDLHLYRNLSLTVMRGERIGIVGVNGAGKTTLLRILAGDLPCDAGRIVWGTNVKVAYYAQHQADQLQFDSTVLNEVLRIAPHLSESRVRSVLGAFLFRGDDVEKVIGVLSGGEKARVALARLLVAPGNVLLMDEPTNHLDLESAELLTEALSEYEGTMLFVSHNRAFIDRLATRIWEIDAGTIHVYPGNLSEYMEHLRARNEYRAFTPDALSATGKKLVVPVKVVTDAETSKVSVRAGKVERRRREAQLRERIQKELGPLKAKIDQMEARIAELEKRREELEKTMADPNLYGRPEFVAALKEFREIEAKIEELMGRWSFSCEQYEQRRSAIEAEHARIS